MDILTECKAEVSLAEKHPLKFPQLFTHVGRYRATIYLPRREESKYRQTIFENSESTISSSYPFLGYLTLRLIQPVGWGDQNGRGPQPSLLPNSSFPPNFGDNILKTRKNK